MTKKKPKIASISINYVGRGENDVMMMAKIGWEHYEIEGHASIDQAVRWAVEAFYEEYDSSYEINTIGRKWQTGGNHNLEYCMNRSYLRSPRDLKMLRFYDKARKNATGKEHLV
jgi:hypothetical protein